MTNTGRAALKWEVYTEDGLEAAFKARAHAEAFAKALYDIGLIVEVREKGKAK